MLLSSLSRSYCLVSNFGLKICLVELGEWIWNEWAARIWAVNWVAKFELFFVCCWLAACTWPYRELSWWLNHFIVITLYQQLHISYLSYYYNFSLKSWHRVEDEHFASLYSWLFPTFRHTINQRLNKRTNLNFTLNFKVLTRPSNVANPHRESS